MNSRIFILPLFAFLLCAGVSACKPANNGAKKGPAADKPVPVLTAKAVGRDVPVWLENTGTVQAFNSVSVRPRVSGILMSVDFTEGQKVAKGDILAQIDKRPYEAVLAQALSKQAQNAAILKNAQIEHKRIKEHVADDAESQRVLDEQEAKVMEFEARTKEDAATVAAAQLDLDFTTLRSPIDGLTGFRHIDSGNTVTANQSTDLVVVTQTQPISVIFSLPKKHLAVLRPSDLASGSATFPVEAIGDETGDVLGEGVLKLVDNQVDLATDSIRLKATFQNANGTLWPNQYVVARVHVRTLKGAVVVPAEAVVPGLDGPMVYIVGADNKAEVRPVVPGHELKSEGLVVVEKGLALGDVVVREGQNKLKPGAKISLVEDPKR
jgi:multidrug efflux system membrane fusion protein